MIIHQSLVWALCFLSIIAFYSTFQQSFPLKMMSFLVVLVLYPEPLALKSRLRLSKQAHPPCPAAARCSRRRGTGVELTGERA